MSPLYIFHVLLTLLVLSIPCWPVSALRYGIYVPTALAVLWFLCDGCPISHMQSKELHGQSFVQSLLSPVVKLSGAQVERLSTVLMLGVTLIAHVRLQNS